MGDDAKSAIADLVAQRTISEIDTISDDVNEKLIALECGHIFTVETLDGHCSMSEYYEIDPMTGGYLGMKAPPTKYQTPPTCPTCRGPITSPRYSRVTKRAGLDILEQNVACNMSKQLEKYGPSLKAISAGLEASEKAAKAIANGGSFASAEGFAQICERRKELFGEPEQPLPVYMLRRLKAFHGFSSKEAEAWTKIAKEINRVYGAIAGVTSTRSAHVKAYEATFATLLEVEMKTIARDPSKANGKTQHEAAFAAASAKIGQPPPNADLKYHMEAFLLTIELRLLLAQIASSRISELPLVPGGGTDHSRHRRIWVTFVGFLYDSCIKDCAKAISLARNCSALRQEARISTVNLRCTFEKARFDALEERQQIQISVESGDPQTRARERSGELVSRQKAEALEALSKARTRYFQNRPANSQEEKDQEKLWFEENCASKAERVFAAYDELREQVLEPPGALYQRMSLQEKRDIVNSFIASGTERRLIICMRSR